MQVNSGLVFAVAVIGLIFVVGPAMADNNTTNVSAYSYNNGFHYNNGSFGNPGSGGMENTMNVSYNMTDIQPYSGNLGPSSSLYGLRLAFENLDDSFTFNKTELLEKELQQADDRIAELESELAANRVDGANRALDQYQRDMNRTERTLSWFNETQPLPEMNGTTQYTGPETGSDQSSPSSSSTGSSYVPPAPFQGSETGSGNTYQPTVEPFNTGYTPMVNPVVLRAQQQLLLHQDILNTLAVSHPTVPNLVRAYNTNQNLEQRFISYTRQEFEIHRDVYNHPIVHMVPVVYNYQNHTVTVIHPAYVPVNTVRYDQYHQNVQQTNNNNVQYHPAYVPTNNNNTQQTQYHSYDRQTNNNNNGQYYPAYNPGNRYNNNSTVADNNRYIYQNDNRNHW